jgi:hypothetical protein
LEACEIHSSGGQIRMSFVSKNNDRYIFKKDRIKKDKKLGFLYHDIFRKAVNFAKDYPKLTFLIFPSLENYPPERAFSLGALYMAMFLVGKKREEITQGEVDKLEDFLNEMEISVTMFELAQSGEFEIGVDEKTGDFAFKVTEKGKKKAEEYLKTDEGALFLFELKYNELTSKGEDPNTAIIKIAKEFKERFNINIIRILARNKDKIEGLIIRDDEEGFEDFAREFD